jgi:hypothetical protein
MQNQSASPSGQPIPFDTKPDQPVARPGLVQKVAARWNALGRLRLRTWLILALSPLLLVFVGGELLLRLYVGLGDPPLLMRDPLMSYRFVPSQTCERLHHLIHYNAYSMRSDDFPPKKSDPAELRVLMIGDSVINGGVMIDQSKLVSTLLQKDLSDDLHRPVIVGNASAGGWGTPNELGWVKTFGTMDADIVVIVVSSHNYANAQGTDCQMGFPVGRPEHKPILAWQEFLLRYSFYILVGPPPESFVDPDNPSQAAIDRSSSSLKQMISIAHAAHAKVIVAQHAQKQELGEKWKPGHAYNLKSAKSGGADLIIQFGPAFEIARETVGDPYRTMDNIHPSAIGHQIMADELRHAIEKVLNEEVRETHPQ